MLSQLKVKDRLFLIQATHMKTPISTEGLRLPVEESTPTGELTQYNQWIRQVKNVLLQTPPFTTKRTHKFFNKIFYK